MGRPGVLLDRDGTIIVDHGYVGSVNRVEFIPGAIESIAMLNAAGLPVVVVTNQAGVARGLYGLDDVTRVHTHIDEELARFDAHVDLWVSCPYHPDGVVPELTRNSQDRKPEPGMALAAAAELCLDLGSSWVVGDRPEDIGLARSIGATPLFIGAFHDASVRSVPDLATAVRVILASDGHATAGLPIPSFPTGRYESAQHFASDYMRLLSRALASVDTGEFDRAAKILGAAYERDAAVFVCGNGGSASISNHLQCDHVKGLRAGTGLRTRVSSLSSNVEILSAIANDIDYDSVFEYQLQSLARPADVLLVVSSSGRSRNIVRALEWAANNQMQTVALTGFDGGQARTLATVSIHVSATNYGLVEDAHQALMHMLAQYIRQSRMNPDAVAAGVF